MYKAIHPTPTSMKKFKLAKYEYFWKQVVALQVLVGSLIKQMQNLCTRGKEKH